MMVFRALVLIGLTAAILGGSAYFAYELYYKPRLLDLEDKRAFQASTPTPPPDFSLPAFEKAMALEKSGDPAAFAAALAAFATEYPDAPNAPKAREIAGRLNAERLFSPTSATDKAAYTVTHGDSLARIAAKTKSSAELIYRANGLDSINLKIGQTLLVPKVDIRITVDRKAQTVTLYNGGTFFKEYPVLALKTPGLPASKPVDTKVAEKMALKGSQRVAFGDRSYPEADRWIMLGTSAVAIRSPKDNEAPPPGIVVSPADLEEIFLLVSRGTPVTIN